MAEGKDSHKNPELGANTFELPPANRAVVECNSIPTWTNVDIPTGLANKFTAEEFQALVDQLNGAWRKHQWTGVQMIPLALLIIPGIIVGCRADTKSCAAMIAWFEGPSTATLLKSKGLSGSARVVKRWREANPGTWDWVKTVEFTFTGTDVAHT